ncbi:MAG: phage terminase large subunit [Chloroflexota bacterium]|nr:phage terminase large subunit [Chloroflexota bacterium]
MLLAKAAPVPVYRSLARDLAAALDPVVFARSAGIEPDGWQADVLRSPSRRMLLNCSRQSGKSTTTALLALHTATYQAGSLILLLSPSLRQSAELFRTVARQYAAAGAQVPSTAESRLRLELENGSRIISLPASEATIRGFAGVDLLIVDEAARVADDLYASVRPMLATSNGRLIALSTPFGTRGWWYQAWRGDQDWKRVMVTAEQCSRISAAFLAEERENLGEWWYRQEYFAEFMDAESQAFSRADIDAAFTKVVTWQL